MGEHIPCATGVLHRSEGGVRQLHITATAVDYARELARYISCPTTVRVRTLEEYGRAPSLDRIRVMRARHVEARNAFRRESALIGADERDGVDFQVSPTFSIPKPRPQPVLEPFIASPLVATIPSSGPEIIAAIAQEFDFTAADIRGPRRIRKVMLARCTCAYVLRARGNSYSLIGNWIGRDHSTIINACRQFDALATPAMRELAERYIGGAA